MGDQWNLSALTYSLFVGDCDGHSTGGCHGAGERDPEVVDFDSGIVLVSECVLTELVIAPLSPYGQNSDRTVGIVC